MSLYKAIVGLGISIAHMGRESTSPMNRSGEVPVPESHDDVVEGSFRMINPEPKRLSMPRGELLPKATWIPK
jgi:hypothetical protein